MGWKVSGIYFEGCSCELVCPCYSGLAPTYDFCEGNGVWHIKSGTYEGVPLDGLNVAMAIRCVGLMRDNTWKCWFYIDDRSTSEQYEALSKIFTAQAGGSIGKIFKRLWDVQSVQRAGIIVSIQGWQHKASIKDFFKLTIGKLFPEYGPTLCRLPNTPGLSAEAEEDWFRCDGLQFDHKHKNGLSTTFEYHSEQ